MAVKARATAAPPNAGIAQHTERVGTMQDQGYKILTTQVSQRLAELRGSTPGVMKAFGELGRAATAPGALDAKTKELIALALGVAARCDPCIGFHAQPWRSWARRGRRSTKRWGWPPTWAAARR